jgi:hypothetical protein
VNARPVFGTIVEGKERGEREVWKACNFYLVLERALDNKKSLNGRKMASASKSLILATEPSTHYSKRKSYPNLPITWRGPQ